MNRFFRNSLRSVLMLSLLSVILTAGMSSCLDNDKDEDYTEWREKNDKYVADMEMSGNYERITPVWAPGIFILMKYHVRPANYASMLTPLSNSTVDIKYKGMLMDSTVFDSSYNRATYGDSIYRCQPCKMVDGFAVALTEMVPGDSVTVIIPSQAGYGITGNTSIKPYSTLIFDIKMKRIYRYDSSSN